MFGIMIEIKPIGPNGPMLTQQISEGSSQPLKPLPALSVTKV